jgi:hypothetical protein
MTSYNSLPGVVVEIEDIEHSTYGEIQITIKSADGDTLVEVQVTEGAKACSVRFCDRRVTIHTDDIFIKADLALQLSRH